MSSKLLAELDVLPRRDPLNNEVQEVGDPGIHDDDPDEAFSFEPDTSVVPPMIGPWWPTIGQTAYLNAMGVEKRDSAAEPSSNR